VRSSSFMVKSIADEAPSSWRLLLIPECPGRVFVRQESNTGLQCQCLGIAHLGIRTWFVICAGHKKKTNK
jgi:hypothetical protein